jgi:hemolysin III
MTRDSVRRQRAADAVIHVLGIMAAVTCVPLLIVITLSRQEPLPAITASVYGITLVAALTISGAYNLLSDARMKERLRPYDHAAIFLLIAGTYTPFSLVTIGGTLGWVLCMSVWAVAVTGAVLKFFHRRRYERFFILGGILYTTGVAFHLRETLPYSTAVWHGFVLAAAACHYLAILQALAPSL